MKNNEVEVKEKIQEVESAETEAVVETPETQEQKLTVIDKAYGKYCAHREKVAEKKANRKPMSKEAKLGIGAAALAVIDIAAILLHTVASESSMLNVFLNFLI